MIGHDKLRSVNRRNIGQAIGPFGQQHIVSAQSGVFFQHSCHGAAPKQEKIQLSVLAENFQPVGPALAYVYKMLPVVIDQNAPAFLTHQEGNGRFVKLIIGPVLIGMPPQIQPLAVSLSQAVEALPGQNGNGNAEGRMLAPFHGRIVSCRAVGIADNDALSRAMLRKTVFELFQLLLPFSGVFFRPPGDAEAASVGQTNLPSVPFDSRTASRRFRMENVIPFQQRRRKMIRHS